MLVLKRALSFSLSFALAFSPTLAFAATNDQQEPEFQAESRKEYQRAEAAATRAKNAAQRAQAKAVAKATAKSKALAKSYAKNTKRKPASTAPVKPNSFEDVVQSMYHTVMYKGQEVTITQVPGVGGRAKSQVIHGPDFDEILVDEFNTGTASTMKLSRGNVDITATHPFHGAFSQIEIRERRAKSYVHAYLQMNPDEKTFRVANYMVEPFHTDHDSVALTCSSQVTGPAKKMGIDSLKAVIDELSAKYKTPEDGLACRLTHFQEALFDKSCYEGKYAGSATDMAKGLAKVFSSAPSVGQPLGAHQGKYPRYLQCLNEYGFANNAAQMQAHFIYDKVDATSLIKDASHRSDSQQVADTKSCDELKTLDIHETTSGTYMQTGTMALTDVTSKTGVTRPFTCDAKMKVDGEYRPPVSPSPSDAIALGENSAEMAADYKTNAPEAYASVIFHEMLHQSGIEEADGGEELVAQLQMCCASPDSSSFAAQKNCSDLKRTVSQQVAKAAAETKMAIYFPSYAKMKQDAISALGMKGGDKFMAEWYAGLEADPAASKAWEQLQVCAAKPNANIDSCTKASQKAFTTYTDQFIEAKAKDTNSNAVSGLKDNFEAELKFQVGKGAMPRIPPGGYTVPTIIAASDDTVKTKAQVQLVATIVDPKILDPKIYSMGAIPNDANFDSKGNQIAATTPKASPKTVKPTSTVAAAAKPPVRLAAAPNPGTATNPVTADSTDPNVVPEIVVTARKLPKPATLVDLVKPDTQLQDLKQPDFNVTLDKTTASPVTNLSTNDGGAADSSSSTQSSDSSKDTTTASTNASSDPASAAQSGNLASPPVSKGVPASAASLASTKAMPALSTTGAVPLSSSQGQAMTATNNSIQTAQALSSSLASAGSGIINSFASSPTVQASAGLATQVAQARMPASLAPPQPVSKSSGSSAPSRVSSHNSNSGSDDESSGGGSSTKAKSKKDGDESSGDQDKDKVAKGDDTGDKDPTKAGLDSEGRQMDPKTSAAVASLTSLRSAKPQEVLIRLKAIDPATFSHELSLGDRSAIVQALQANGWTIIQKSSRQILMNPKGQCFAPDPRKTIVPRANCE